MSSTAIFLSQQSRQYFSSPRGSETSFALQSAQRTFSTDLRGMGGLYQFLNSATPNAQNSQGNKAKLPFLSLPPFASLLGGFGRWELGVDWALGVAELRSYHR